MYKQILFILSLSFGLKFPLLYASGVSVYGESKPTTKPQPKKIIQNLPTDSSSAPVVITPKSNTIQTAGRGIALPGFSQEYINEISQMGTFESLRKLQRDDKLKPFFKANSRVFKSFGEDQLAQNIFDKSSGIIQKVFQVMRRLPLLFARIARDENAFSGLAGLILDKKNQLNYLGLFAISLIVGLFIKFKGGKENTFFQRVTKSLFLFFSIWTLRFGGFIFLFREHLKPLWPILKQTYFTF